MKLTNESAKSCFENGEADLANAYLILTAPHTQPNLFGIACFHAQQAVEKYLKGFLIEHEQKVPLVHDLKILLDKCREFDSNLDQFEDICKDLTPYYIETRYEPASPADFDEDEAWSAYHKAEKILNYFKEI